MKRKKNYSIASVLVLAFVLFACRTETVEVYVENVTLNMSTATMQVSGTLTLVATIEPEDAYNQEVKWTSSKLSVATVNDDGVVTALSTGTTTIIVTTEDGGFSATCDVTVISPVSTITINHKTISLTIGNSMALTATITPSDAPQAVTWASSNSAIASVDNNGRVTGIAEGTATIRATTQQDATKFDDCTVTVTKATIPVVAVTLNQSTAALTTGNTLTLTETVLPATATDKTVTWFSSAPSVATVNNNGLVTAVSPGAAIIVVSTTDGKFEASCNVTVNAAVVPVESIFVDPPSLTMNLTDAPYTLTHTIAPANATNKNITWTSNKPSVATVTANGVVTPIAVGTAAIIATTVDGGKTDACIVTVEIPNEPVLSVSLPATLAINGSETKTLTASILPIGATNKNVTWTSSDPTVVANNITETGLTVDIIPVAPTGGVTTPRTTTITVTTADGSKTASCVVTVTYVAVTGVTVAPATLTKAPLQTETLTATVLPANASIKTVTWSSSAPTLVEVLSPTSGVILTRLVGTATITATSVDNPSESDNCIVTVL